MATIGTFTQSGDSFTGVVKTLNLSAKTTIKPAEKARDQVPGFPAPVYAILVESEEPGRYSLIWSRCNGD